MRELFELIILDFHRRLKRGDLPQPVKRDIRLPFLPQKVSAVIGIRRGGKTWFLLQKIKELQSEGVPLEKILYLNFEDERLLPISGRDLDVLLQVYQGLYPQVVGGGGYLFLDEIQNVPGWELFVRRVSEQEGFQIVVTGSSAKLLSREIATCLRGRSIPVEVFPLSFKEFLRFHGLEVPTPLRVDSQLRAKIVNLFKEYMRVGGFPEVQSYTELDRFYTLQEYVRSIVFRDIVERYGVRNIWALKQIIAFVLQNPAALLSVNRLFRYLKSLGVRVDKNFVYEIADYLQDVYFASLVPKFTYSEKARQVSPSKLYLIDQGLIISHLKRPTPDWGRLLENMVFLELRRHPFGLEYYRSEGAEVDFVVTERLSGRRVGVQVSLSLRTIDTREREFSALREIVGKGIVDSALVITLEEEEYEFQQEELLFRLIPAWRFLLQAEECLFG